MCIYLCVARICFVVSALSNKLPQKRKKKQGRKKAEKKKQRYKIIGARKQRKKKYSKIRPHT